MPIQITWDEANPRIERHGFTDYLQTNKGWKPIRVFDGRGQGRFRLTRVGMRFYEKNTLNHYVIQLPALSKFSESLRFFTSNALFFVPKDPLGPDNGPKQNYKNN